MAQHHIEPIKVTVTKVVPQVTINTSQVGTSHVTTGRQGPPGPRGPGVPEGGDPGQAIVKSEGGTEWADVVATVEHGDDPNVPRPDSEVVIWRGTVEPLYWTDHDIWHDLSE